MRGSMSAIQESNTLSPLLEPTEFVTDRRGSEKFYFKNNSHAVLRCFRIFRYCVACGECRFSDKQWPRTEDTWQFGREELWVGQNKLGHIACIKQLERVPGYVPLSFYEVDEKGAFPAEIPSKVYVKTFDTVYTDRQSLPAEFAKEFLDLEKLPLHLRIEQIIQRRWGYVAAHDCRDHPYLQALDEYLQKCKEVQKKPPLVEWEINP